MRSSLTFGTLASCFGRKTFACFICIPGNGRMASSSLRRWPSCSSARLSYGGFVSSRTYCSAGCGSSEFWYPRLGFGRQVCRRWQIVSCTFHALVFFLVLFGFWLRCLG